MKLSRRLFLWLHHYVLLFDEISTFSLTRAESSTCFTFNEITTSVSFSRLDVAGAEPGSRWQRTAQTDESRAPAEKGLHVERSFR